MSKSTTKANASFSSTGKKLPAQFAIRLRNCDYTAYFYIHQREEALAARSNDMRLKCAQLKVVKTDVPDLEALCTGYVVTRKAA